VVCASLVHCPWALLQVESSSSSAFSQRNDYVYFNKPITIHSPAMTSSMTDFPLLINKSSMVSHFVTLCQILRGVPTTHKHEGGLLGSTYHSWEQPVQARASQKRRWKIYMGLFIDRTARKQTKETCEADRNHTKDH
jgi:hypothetical protein